MCTHDQRALFMAHHIHPMPEECEQLQEEMNAASNQTALIFVSGIVILSPILGFAIGGPIMGLIWSAFAFVYLCFISIPFMVAANHDARTDAHKAHLA